MAKQDNDNNIFIEGEDEFDYLDDAGSDNSEEEKPKISIEIKKSAPPVESEIPQTEESKENQPHIYVVKVTTNKEDTALDMIADKIRTKNVNVYSIARPHGLRGYILLESPDRENAEEAVFNLPYVKGIIPKVISYEEVKNMLEPITADVKIEKDDVVEIIAEPFKKEKAKVVRVDKAKGEAVVSLLGAAVPIPVTVKISNLRVIRREDKE